MDPQLSRSRGTVRTAAAGRQAWQGLRILVLVFACAHVGRAHADAQVFLRAGPVSRLAVVSKVCMRASEPAGCLRNGKR